MDITVEDFTLQLIQCCCAFMTQRQDYKVDQYVWVDEQLVFISLRCL